MFRGQKMILQVGKMQAHFIQQYSNLLSYIPVKCRNTFEVRSVLQHRRLFYRSAYQTPLY